MSRDLLAQHGPSARDPDASLVRDLKCGTPEGFRELLSRYQNSIFAYVAHLINDPVEAEDVTQDVFVKVFRKIGGFREDCSFKTWLYRIAANESSNRRRWFSRHRSRNLPDAAGPNDPGFAARLADPRGSPFEQVQHREHRQILNEALQALDPRFREAVVLRDIAGFSYNEVAETLGISMGTVKSRILRGREALKRHLLRSAPSVVAHGVRWQTE